MVWEGPNDENVWFSLGFHLYFIDFDGSWGGGGVSISTYVMVWDGM